MDKKNICMNLIIIFSSSHVDHYIIGWEGAVISGRWLVTGFIENS